jgi:uncharacterized protein YkwD
LLSFRFDKGLCALLASISLAAPVLLATPAIASSTPAPCTGAVVRPSAGDLGGVAVTTLCLVNEVRSAHRLHALHANHALRHVAIAQVRQMVALDYFADVGPGGQTPLSLIAATGYGGPSAGFAVGQNLAWGTGTYTTPTRIVAAWMASPPHRAIILDGAFRDAGVAAIPAVPEIVAPGQVGATYAMEFGVRG